MGSKLSININNFKPVRSNTLYGLADVEIPEMHLVIRECPVHESHGHRWVCLPGRLQLDRQGTALRNDRGKIAYQPMLKFTDRLTAEAFSRRVIQQLVQQYPKAFNNPEATGTTKSAPANSNVLAFARAKAEGTS